MSTVLEPSELHHVGRSRRSALACLSGSRVRLLAISLPGVVAIVVWRLSLLHVDVTNLDSYGLPPALPLIWYLALLLAVVGAVSATTARRTNPLIMAGYLVVIVFILYGTVPVLSAQPHYAWVYKHIGVVRYIEAHGHVNASIDIYNRWPGFFASGAVFSVVAGRPNPETYASWAELLFCLLDAVVVMAAVKAITRDVRVAAGASLLFLLTNWVGQTYYSPQAFSFLLGLTLCLIVLRQLRIAGSGSSQWLTRLLQRVGRVRQLPSQTEDGPKWPRWAAASTVLGLDAVIVASHQLTPYMLLVSVALLMLVGVVRPWWVLLGMAVMTFAYLGANYSFIKHNYGVFTSIDPFNNAQGQGATISNSPTAGKVLTPTPSCF